MPERVRPATGRRGGGGGGWLGRGTRGWFAVRVVLENSNAMLRTAVLLASSDLALGLGWSASDVYDHYPWNTEGEFSAAGGVSLDPPPVPGDGGLMGAIQIEVENFTVTPVPGHPPAFNVTEWGRDHYYGATFENTFAHRKALLHSTNTSVGTATSPPVGIPKAATYYVGVRYEAAYRFETEFTLTVKQGSASKFTKLYGQRASPKMWSFGYSERNHEIAGCPGDPTPECHWTWGATENWVWEYYPVPLAAGSATFEISITNTTSKPGLAPLADRNIDAMVLTTNLTDIEMRAKNEQGSVPMDGLFTQRGEVFMKVTNHGNDDMLLNVPFCAYHSSYAPMHMFCIPYCQKSSNGLVYGSVSTLEIPVPKGATTPQWVEVGSRLDTMNDGTWEFTARVMPPPKPPPPPPGKKPPPPPPPPPPFAPAYSIQFGVMEKGSIVPISTPFSTTTAYLQVAFDANTVGTKRVRRPDASIDEALAEAKTAVLPAGATPPKLTPIWGYTFCTSTFIRDIEPACFLESSLDPGYAAKAAEFNQMFPISDTNNAGIGMISADQKANKRGYFEARAIYTNPTALANAMGNLTAAGVGDDYMVVSMGDEIALATPSGAAGATLFKQFLSQNHYPAGLPFNATICFDPVHCNPEVFYYSNLFVNAYGLSVLAPATKKITAALKNAGVGANYSPLAYSAGGYTEFQYWYPVNKAVTIFREGAMTLPWSEDYTWQSPIGTQQMTTILHDLFRAGLRGVDKTPQTSRMMSYIMAHAPGTTAKMWRRAMFGYLAHGVTMINLYEFRPCLASYTENYVDAGWGMYGAVRQALGELSLFEDIIQDGRVAYGDVGIWNSDVMDIWGPATQPVGLTGEHFNTFLAGKRAM